MRSWDVSDLQNTLAIEYRNARLRMQDLAAELTADEIETVVGACPEWRVHDLFSHCVGLAGDLAAGKRPSGDTQAWVDGIVESRRTVPFADIVAEWSTAGPAFEAMIDAMPKPIWALTYDTIVHEHDLRAAVGKPGARDSAGVRLAFDLGMKMVRGDLSTNGLPAFRVVLDDGAESVVGEGEPELTLHASPFEALRLLGSRRTETEMRAAAFEGDLDRYFPGLKHMDLPVESLGE
jgi:uncharacterized protein (TIGR03083 family)